MIDLPERAASFAVFLVLLAIAGLLPHRSAALEAHGPVAAAAASLPTESLSARDDGQALTVIHGKIDRKPVHAELLARGVAPADALTVTRAFKGVFDFRRAQPEDQYQVCLTAQGELQKLVYRAGPADRYVAVRAEDGTFHSYHEKIALDREITARTFTIDSSLYQAVTHQGEGYELVSELAGIFSWDIDFYLYPRKGDTIRVLFEKFTLEGRFVKYGRILAAQYIGGSETFSAFYFNGAGRGGYYDENGSPLRKLFLRVPVQFGKCTSSYSHRRFHPISKRYRPHTGIDYGVPSGTPIFATADGTVEFAGWQGGYGKLMVVRHGNGLQTYYGHCSRLLVAKGARVKQGQVIARVGQTGQATGPHVHYEVRVNGRPVDPAGIKSDRAARLPPEQLATFEATVRMRLRQVAEILLTENSRDIEMGM